MLQPFLLILDVGLPAVQVLSAPESGAQTTQENTGQGWHEALKTQVALARICWHMRQRCLRMKNQANKFIAKMPTGTEDPRRHFGDQRRVS